MITKKRCVSLLMIVIAMVCLLLGILPIGEATSVSASRDSNGTNTDGEWTGSQTTPNLIPTLKAGSIASQGWKVGSDNDSRVAANTVEEKDIGKYVIKSNGDWNDIGGKYTGGVYYTLTLSEADRAKANAGQLKISASAGFFAQMWFEHCLSIRAEFYNSDGAQIGNVPSNHSITPGGNTTKYWTLDATNVPSGTCSIQVWFSNYGGASARPYIADPSCYLHDTTAPSVTGNVYLDKTSVADSGKGIAVAGNTIKYSVELNEKVSITANGTASITLNGNSFASSSSAKLETVSGKSRVVYTFTLPDVNQNGEIKFSNVSGLSVKDEAGNSATVTGGAFPSAPTLQYYRKMNVSSSLTHLTISGGGKATYNQNYTATLSPAHGYNLPSAITIKVGGSALALNSDYTYDSGTGVVTIYGSKITDDIVITAAGVAKQSVVTLHKESGIGGSETATATFDASMPAIDAPTRTGYTFQGYFTQSGGEGTKYYDATGHSAKICDFDVQTDLYAYWTANHYTIKFDANKPTNASSEVQGDTPEMPRIYDDGEKALPKCSFALMGWTFRGWATEKSGGVTYTDGRKVVNLTPNDGGAFTLFAVWEANEYTLTLNAMGGNNGGSTGATFDSTLRPLSVLPERHGYNFVGYFDAAEGGEQYYDAEGKAFGDKTLTVVGGVTLYAHWSPITYTIWLYSDGSYITKLDNVVYGKLELPTAEELGLSKKNFDFVGWNIYAEQDWKMYNADQLYDTGLTGKQGEIVVLHASWAEKPIHALYYDPNGGSGAPATAQVHEEETIILSEMVPTRADHTFVGWATSADAKAARYQPEGEFTMGTEVVTLYAVWKHNPSFSYDANGGQLVHSIAVVYPAPEVVLVITEVVPVREGHEFLGWAEDSEVAEAQYHANDSFTMPTDDVTLYAVWHRKDFKATTSVAEGCEISGLQEEYAYGDELSITVTGDDVKVYINGVRLFDEGGHYTYTVTGDISIVVADSSSHVLLYSANGGEDAPTDKHFYTNSENEATVSGDAPTRTGYQFVGWAKSKDASPKSISGGMRILSADDDTIYQAGESVTFDGDDVTLYAVWVANTYTVTYDSNADGVEGNMAPSGYAYGTADYLSENAYVRAGYVFVGWALSKAAADRGDALFEDGASVINLSEQNHGNVTLYGVWEKLRTMITFDAAGGGGGSANLSVGYGEMLPDSGYMAPIRDGYTFAGYFTEEDGAGEMIFDEKMRPVDYAGKAWDRNEQTLVLYAYWIPTPETIEDTIGEVQSNLYMATQQLYAALDDSQSDLEGKLAALDAAYKAADTLLESRYLSADSGLQDQIDSLKTAMGAADDALKVAIQAVESKLDSAVNDLKASIETNKSNLQSELEAMDKAYKAADEIVRGEFASKDTELQNQIDSLRSTLTSADASLQSAIDDLKKQLESAVDGLETSMATDKSQLESKLSTLEDAYMAADNLLRSDFAAADSGLRSQIDSLTSALKTADEKLQAAIDRVQDNLDSAVENLRSSIASNKTELDTQLAALKSAYEAADLLIRSDISGLQAADSALSQRIEALQSAHDIATKSLQDAVKQVQDNLDSAVKNLQSSIDRNETDIEQKVSDLDTAYKAADSLLRSDLEAADEELDGKITALQNALNTADFTLQASIKQVQDNLDKAVKELQDTIQKNETDIEQKVSDLDTAYKNANTLLRSEVVAADEELDGKITALQNKLDEINTALQASIKQVQDNLDKAVKGLQDTIQENETDIEQKVSDLDTAYKNADTLLRSEMAAADDALDGKITALRNALDEADSALKASVKQVQDNLDRAVEELRAAITGNKTDIEQKVAAMDEAYKAARALIDSDISGLKAQDEALAASISALDSAYRAADEALWEGIRQVEQKHDAMRQENDDTAFTYMIVNIVLGGVAAAMVVTLVVKAIKRRKAQK